MLPKPPSSTRRRSSRSPAPKNGVPINLFEGLSISGKPNEPFDVFSTPVHEGVVDDQEIVEIENEPFDVFSTPVHEGVVDDQEIVEIENEPRRYIRRHYRHRDKEKKKSKSRRASMPTVTPSMEEKFDSSHSRRHGRRTADDSDAKPSIPRSIQVDALPTLHKGTPFLKYGRSGFPHFRQFQLTPDNTAIQWFSKGKRVADTTIQLSRISNIVVGQTTSIFARHPAPELVNASFSVLYDNDKRSLDVIARCPIDFRIWVQGLNALVRLARSYSSHQMGDLDELLLEMPNSDAGNAKRYNNANFTQEKIDLIRREAAELRGVFEECHKRSSTGKIYVSTQYANIIDTLQTAEVSIKKIEEGIHLSNWAEADDMIWKTSVDLEAINHLMSSI